MIIEITPASLAELKQQLDSEYTRVNQVRKGDRYAQINSYFMGGTHYLQIIKWQDGKTCAIEPASTCKTIRGAQKAIAQFLGLQ